MNGSTGIQPTVELATTNGAAYPFAYPMYGNGNGGFFGGDGIWALVLLALLFGNGGWGNGFGGNGWNNVATTDYVSSEFTQRDINSGFQNTNNLISSGFSNTATNLCNVRSDILTGNMGLQNSILDAKYSDAINASNTQRDILTQTTQLENQLAMTALQNQAHIDSCCCDIKSLIREDGEQTRALITQNTIQDLRDKLTSAENQLSDQTVINAVRPYPVPAYLTGSPYGSYPFYNGFSYGNGFFGNTIV